MKQLIAIVLVLLAWTSPARAQWSDIPNATGTGAGLAIRTAINSIGSGVKPIAPKLVPLPFASLPAEVNGQSFYVTDGSKTNPCSGGGTGAVATGIAGAWSCGGGGSTPLPASIAGNGLVNFFNSGLTNNGHKQILIVGNSTVWNATSYYNEMCNEIGQSATGNFLFKNGISPCVTTGISGYQIFDNVGHIEITFTGSTPSGYNIGDLVLSQANGPCSNNLEGSGVITAVGATTIDYTMISWSVLPSTAAFTSCTGVFTNSIINLGQNGADVPNIITKTQAILTTYTHPGDLVLVRGPLINDVRQGACNLACAISHVTSLYNMISAAIPSNADIAWKTENSMLTTDPTSSGFVSPLGSSSAYSKILHDAVFQALAALPARAVVWDDMQIVWTKLGFESATSVWMADILHPNAAGQLHEAAADMAVFQSLQTGKGLPSSQPADPYLNTAGNAALLNGSPTGYIDSLRALVGFSSFMEEHALSDNYAAPYTLYPDAVLDTSRYSLVTYGVLNLAGSGFIRFTHPAPNGATVAEVKSGDIVWIQGYGTFVVPSGFGQSPVTTGGVVYAYQLTGLGGVVPTINAPSNPPVVIMRQQSFILGDWPFLVDKTSFPYRHSLKVAAGDSGTNFFRIQFTDGTPSWPTGITTADTVALPCGIIPLTGASFLHISTYTQVNLTGSWASCSGTNGYIFGPQALESSVSLLTSTLGQVGTATNDNATGGLVGEVMTTPTTNTSHAVTITIATPGVVGWTAHGLQPGSAIQFTTTGALPTGVSVGPIYYVLSAGFGSNAFQIATTPFGTAINTSGTQSGTHTALSIVTLTTATPTNIAAANLTAGDWDCTGQADYSLAAATSSHFKSGLSATSATFGQVDSFSDLPLIATTLTDTLGQELPMTRFSLATTTPIYLIAQAAFSAGSMNGYGSIYCRRAR